MRHVAAKLPFFLFAVMWGSPVHAEMMDTTASLSAGQLALGAEWQLGLADSSPMALNAREAVGLASGVDLQLRQGFGLNQNQPFYFGAEVKWTLRHGTAKKQRPGVALWAGGHFRAGGNGFGGDASIAIDYPFKGFRPYLAFDANLERINDDFDFMLAIIGGTRIGLSRRADLFVEIGWNLLDPRLVGTGPYGRFVAAGAKFYIG